MPVASTRIEMITSPNAPRNRALVFVLSVTGASIERGVLLVARGSFEAAAANKMLRRGRASVEFKLAAPSGNAATTKSIHVIGTRRIGKYPEVFMNGGCSAEEIG